MADDFRVGDVVVRVNNKPGRRTSPAHTSALSRLVKGKVYRVISLDDDGDIIELTGVYYPLHINYGAYGAHRFRKLPPATDKFTRMVRACKPVREPANA